MKNPSPSKQFVRWFQAALRRGLLKSDQEKAACIVWNVCWIIAQGEKLWS